MIKLPIVLMEHPQGWEAAVYDAVQTQRKLEVEAQNEAEYLRPIVLFQAQNVNESVNVEALRKHLTDELHIAEDQIAVATGDTRELAGIDLFDPKCPIRFIVTVQALREGWDCPFAYVLCSVQSVRSATAVEQLLGRVLRMPYAKRRMSDALNKAYAHVNEPHFGQAASALADRLIQGMGFEALDVASMIAPQLPLPGMDDGPLFARLVLPELAVDVPAKADLPPIGEFAGRTHGGRQACDSYRPHQRLVSGTSYSGAAWRCQQGKSRARNCAAQCNSRGATGAGVAWRCIRACAVAVLSHAG